MLPKNETRFAFPKKRMETLRRTGVFSCCSCAGKVFLLVSHEGAVMLSCNHASTQACKAARTSSLPDPSMVRISHF